MSNIIYLILGSNIHPEQNLRAAISHLSNYGIIKAVSAVWETRPIGFLHQPNFLNCACAIQTELNGSDFQNTTRNIEKKLGRSRTGNKFGPRNIDIDIVLYNNDICLINDRQIPDPEILERGFVAITLAEIAPEYMHPVVQKKLFEIASDFQNEKFSMTKRSEIKLM